MTGITLKNVTKTYGSFTVIPGIDIDIKDGEFIVFVGPSGCGKSTMLRMIAGLEEVSGGSIYFGSEDVTWIDPAKRGAAMVFQSYALYPHMSVSENIEFSLKMAGVPKQVRKEKVQEVAAVLHLDSLLGRLPKDLSGGQRQRVAIGRAIVRHPKVFLFDEPLSNLDAALRLQMRIELARLHQELGTTMIYVTHDQTEAMTLGDKIAVFNEGKIEQFGTPLELYQKPANRFVAEFLGSPKINFHAIEYARGSDSLTLQSFGSTKTNKLGVHGTRLETAASVGFRPESVALIKDLEGLSGTIDFLEILGDVTLVHLVGSDRESVVVAKVQGVDDTLEVGARIGFEIRGVPLLFDSDGNALIN